MSKKELLDFVNIEPKDLTVAWDLGKEGEKPSLAFFLELKGKVYGLAYNDINSGSLNIGEVLNTILEKIYEQKEENKEKEETKNDD